MKRLSLNKEAFIILTEERKEWIIKQIITIFENQEITSVEALAILNKREPIMNNERIIHAIDQLTSLFLNEQLSIMDCGNILNICQDLALRNIQSNDKLEDGSIKDENR